MPLTGFSMSAISLAAAFFFANPVTHSRDRELPVIMIRSPGSEIELGGTETSLNGENDRSDESVTLLSGDCSDYTDLSSMPLPIGVIAVTSGRTNDYGPYPFQPQCWQGSFDSANAAAGPDITFKWTAPADRDFTISALNSNYDNCLEIYRFTCPAEPVYPGDFICGSDDFSNLRPLINQRFTLGQEVLIVVDGHGSYSGACQLVIDYTQSAGDNCADYIDLTAWPLPIHVSGSTVWAANDYGPYPSQPDCWQYEFDSLGAAGPDVTYKWTSPADGDYCFSLLADTFNISLSLYQFTCPAEPIFPDDFICGTDDYYSYYDNQSVLENIRIDQGQEILIVIDGYYGTSGQYSLDIIPMEGPGLRRSCPGNSVYGQPASILTDREHLIVSDNNYGPTMVFDNSPGIDGFVNGIDFWGFDFGWNGSFFMEANEDSMVFRVRFYTDNPDGMPGEIVCTQFIIPTKAEVDTFSSQLIVNYYHGIFNEPCSVSGGWLSIQGTSIGVPEDCIFFWLDSQDGDALSYQGGFGPSWPNYFSMSFCLLDTAGAPIHVETGNPLPTLEIGPNYPNPFNSFTTISYSLANPADVKLEIFNVLGQKIAAIAQGLQGPGKYNAAWNAAMYPSGIYFCHICTGAEKETVRMVLAK